MADSALVAADIHLFNRHVAVVLGTDTELGRIFSGRQFHRFFLGQCHARKCARQDSGCQAEEAGECAHTQGVLSLAIY